MSLAIGARLGPYQIEEPIGAGGMGEVFRARDTRLDRLVAIKILPPDKVADPDRVRRFMQEARTASGLNHPNIVTSHDIAAEGDRQYIVMELDPRDDLGSGHSAVWHAAFGGAGYCYSGSRCPGCRERGGCDPSRSQAGQQHGYRERTGEGA